MVVAAGSKPVEDSIQVAAAGNAPAVGSQVAVVAAESRAGQIGPRHRIRILERMRDSQYYILDMASYFLLLKPTL